LNDFFAVEVEVKVKVEVEVEVEVEVDLILEIFNQKFFDKFKKKLDND